MLKLLKRKYAASAAMLTTAMIMAGEAQAQTEKINKIAQNVQENIAEVPALLTSISYLFGIVLGVLGILKIKDHVENPSQTPLKEGAIRLATGGALFATPIVFDSIETLINGGEETFTQTSAKINKVEWNIQ
jgi:hypothetical protein